MCECPWRDRFGYPYEVSSRVKFQMINDLSRDPDRSIFGFSREVAREVTQPLWPSRVPLRINCSVIIAVDSSTGICKEESLSMVFQTDCAAGSLA